MNRLWGFAFATTASVAVALHVLAYISPADRALWLASGGWTLAAAAAVTGLALGRRRVASDFRRAWAFLLVAALSWLAGQLAWDTYLLLGAEPPAVAASDVLWLLFAVLAAIGVYYFAPPYAPVRRIAHLDAAALVAASTVALVAVFYGSLADSSISVTQKTVALAYPILFCALAIILLETLAGQMSLLRNRGLALILVGIGLEAVGFVWWCPLLLDGSYVAGHAPTDLLWTAGILALAAGGFAAATQNVAVAPLETVLRRRTTLPGLAFVALIGLTINAAVQDWSLASRLTLQSGLAVIGASLVVRAWVASKRYVVTLESERLAKTELERTNSELEAFSSAASHDLKAPLVSIQGFASSLRRRSGDRLDAHSSMYLERIESNAHDLQLLIDEMLDFARVEIRSAEADIIDADEIAREVVRNFRERHAGRGARVELLSPIPALRAHPARFRQALTNLIENSLNHAGAGEPPLVQILAVERNGHVEIAVQDDGRGVAPADRERIFGAFARGEGAGRTNPKGTGLGLALVKKIAEGTGGSIRYEPAPEGGARFVLSLPKGPNR